MPNWGKRKHKVRPGRMKGYKPKRKHGTPYVRPELSAQDKAALANMQPVTIRHIMSGDRNTPRLHPSNTGEGRMVGEYSIRLCNTPRR
ncbi:MAG: hypothetical protein KAJ73_05555 [Zetaproteobacteria bacterium]|nr:hypothetical protein [Zetaproteobacteria bacterium]